MSAPDKCPKCHGETTITADGNITHVGVRYYDQNYRFCLERQRDALAARVKELEPFKQVCENPAALWANWLRGTVALPAGIGDVRQEQARVRELEERLARLIEAGDSMAAWNRNARNLGGDPFLADLWDQAKEAKP